MSEAITFSELIILDRGGDAIYRVSMMTSLLAEGLNQVGHTGLEPVTPTLSR